MSAPATPSTVNFVQAQPFVLAGSGASIGDTTLLLQSMLGIDGVTIVTADLGSFAYGTLEPGNGIQEEAVLFTGITQNANGTATLTGVSSIGFKQPYALTAGVTKTHAGASKFILSNDAAFYNNFTLYMNSIAGAGAANASTAVKGLVQAATSAQINAGTATGSSGAVLSVTPDALAASNIGLNSPTAAEKANLDAGGTVQSMAAGEAITALDAVAFSVAAPAFDATSNGSNSTETLTVSHTCAAGAALIVAASSQGTVSGVTYNGVAMTQIGSQVSSPGGSLIYLFFLANPATGANNIVVTKSAVLGNMCAASYTNVGNVVPSTRLQVAGTSITNAVALTSSGSWAGAVMYGEGGSVITTGIATTLRGQSSATYALGLTDSNSQAKSSSYQLTTTVTSGNNLSMGFEIQGTLTTSAIRRSVTVSEIGNQFIGFAPSAIASGISGNVLTSGLVTGLSGLLPGRYYYQSSTAGAISATGGFRPIGYALSATTLLIWAR